MINKKIAIIGIGNMGKAITKGLQTWGMVEQDKLLLSNSLKDNVKVTENSDIIILAVKPQVIHEVLNQIKEHLNKKKLIISIAAGVSIYTIQNVVGKKVSVVRAMPNLGAYAGESMTCWVKSSNTSKKQAREVRKILASIGKEIELQNEELLSAVTAISGSGPAYIFYIVELLEKAGIQLGVEKNIAQQLAVQTVIGSVTILKSSKLSAKKLREKVTSKGGTTEAAFEEFKKYEFEKIFHVGVLKAFEKSRELSMIY